MNVSSSRPRLWTPQTIAIAVLLHAAVLYYVVTAFHLVPPVVRDEVLPPVIQAVRFNPPPPKVEVDPIVKPPRFLPHHVQPAPVPTHVEPVPFPPQPPAVSTADAGVIALNTEVPEQPISQALPRYPVAALDRNVQGRVVMSITILPDGTVRDVRVIKGTPPGYFENAALRSVQTWRYRPSNVTRTNVIVHMDFVLKDG